MKGTHLSKILVVIFLMVPTTLIANCQLSQTPMFSSLEDLSKMAFQDCTNTRTDNRKKCECQKHNSKIISDVPEQLKTETKQENIQEIKKIVRDNIDEMIQYFLAMESNIELSTQASAACSLARIKQIQCPNTKAPVMSHIYPNGASDLLKQSQCQLKQKYNLPCENQAKNDNPTANSCLDEGTRLSLLFKEQVSEKSLINFQEKLLVEGEELNTNNFQVHPALLKIANNPNLSAAFKALPPDQLQTFIHSPMMNEHISHDVTLSCEQKMQTMQTLLCHDVAQLDQMPLKNIIKSEKQLIKQKNKNVTDIIDYQQQLNLFCQNLDKPSLEKNIQELFMSKMPSNLNKALTASSQIHESVCSKIIPPINFTKIDQALKSCTTTEEVACDILGDLSKLYSTREVSKPLVSSVPGQNEEYLPEFFSKQLRSFYGENTNPKLIEPLPEGKQVSVANYHSEVEEINQGKENSEDFKPVEQTPTQPATPVVGNTKLNTNSTVKHAVTNSIQTKPNNNDEYQYESDQIINTQNKFLDQERKTNAQMMNHFQNINQKQIDMIEKMANRIITQNEEPKIETTQAPNNNIIPNNYQPNGVTPPASSLFVGTNNNPSEGTGSIVYIDNNTPKSNGTSAQLPEESAPTTAPSVTQRAPNSTAPNRSPANIDEKSQNVEVIEKDMTTHKKYDEIIVSLNSDDGEKLSNLKPHELEMINKYLEEKRPFILKKIIKSKKSDKKIDATVLIGDKSFITIIPNHKITPSEQKDYLLIKKELEHMIKIKLSHNKTTSGRFSRL